MTLATPPLAQLPASPSHPLVNTLEYVLMPRRFAARNVAKLGPVYRARGIAGDVVFTQLPEHARRIFSADSDTFDSFATVAFKGLFGPRSIALTSGPVHQQQRRLLAPPLTGSRLRALGATIQAIAEEHVAKLRPRQVVGALELATHFTLDVITRAVFGATSEAAQRELRPLLLSIVSGLPALAIFAPRLQRRWYPAWSRFVRARRAFDVWLGPELERRKRAGRAGDDVLSLLLETRYEDGRPIDAAEIGEQLVTLLLVGHETTAIGIASCLNRALRDARVMARLTAEVDAAGDRPEDVQRLPYLSAVIDEALRVDPVITEVARIPKRPFALSEDLEVAKGQLLVVLIEGLHQDPALYPDPARFVPERFLERKYAPHEYAPFGGGVRRCLGAAFSDYETKLMLATLLRRRSVSLLMPGGDLRVRRNLTMGPRFGVPLRIHARAGF